MAGVNNVHAVTKTTRIPKRVKDAVYRRDDGKCLICKSPGLPEAHLKRRSRLGMGVEENN